MKIENINDITIDYIIDYCKEHDEVKWLKATAAETIECKVYPRIKKDGKSVADKSQEPKIETRPVSFIQIRNAFTEKFMPEFAPKRKPKAPTMYDRIASL